MAALLVLASFAAFFCLRFFFLRASGGQLSPAALSRLLSCVHACALVALAALAIGRPEIGETEWWACWGRALPLGYLAHDALLIWANPSLWDPLMLAHHLAFAVLAAAGTGRYPGLAARAHLAEVSTPLLHASWGMRRCGADARYPRRACAGRLVSRGVLLLPRLLAGGHRL